MRRSPTPLIFRLSLLALGYALAWLPAHAQDEEPLRPGDRIDVTLQTGAIYEYAKVIEVTPDSIMVANPQGVREFAAKNLTADLQARLPGAVRASTPPPAAPEPVATPVAAPTPTASEPAATNAQSAVDLDALAEALSAKLAAAQANAPGAPQPVAMTSEFPSSSGNTLYQALAMGLLLIIPTLNVLATRSVILQASGAAVPMWILAVWLLPLIGCLCAFAALGRSQAATAPVVEQKR